ncbi:MAG: hypothetical protein DHS20C19_23650 [Acidimicrobiales bacterium]|nr:MAG: hypothetical protein DHS20C19_23650 [Acidimicrobiales bacterium]
MDKKTAKQLGDILRKRRQEKGLSTRALADAADTASSTIVRIEQGEFAAPRPDALAQIALALDLPASDIFALAGYTTPNDLPTLSPYLHSRYRDLPDETIQQIETYINELIHEHGTTLAGPEPGKDEKDS